MHDVSMGSLRDIRDHAFLLAGILQIPPSEQKAQYLRKAEKSLINLEVFFTQELASSAKKWQEAYRALKVLLKKKEDYFKEEELLKKHESRIQEYKNFTKKWFDLSEEERLKIQKYTNLAKKFIEEKVYIVESHILNRYQRYHALKNLLPYADNAEYLCEAIYHYENKEKYKNNEKKLLEKKKQAEERERNVRNGCILALIFCIFVVTIPLCFPFVIKLWNRRREIRMQITTIDDTLRREAKRIQAAEEGVIASETIRNILGNVSLEQIQRTLLEVRELRGEFQRLENPASLSVEILAFLENSTKTLQHLFGDIPADPVASIRWLVENVQILQNMEVLIREEQEQIEKIKNRQRKLLKGYNIEILCRSIENLQQVKSYALPYTWDDEIIEWFVDIAYDMPSLLLRIRHHLWELTHGLKPDFSSWHLAQLKIQGYANILACIILNADLSADDVLSELEMLEQCSNM